MVTIIDVAKAAGVSKSTVSLVINSSPLVKKETRIRVERVIRAMNYVPNYNARSLKRKDSICIGIIHITNNNLMFRNEYEWNFGLNQFSRDIEDGIFEGVIHIGGDLSVVKEHFYVTSKKSDAPNLEAMPKILQNSQVDGAIFIGSLSSVKINEFMKNIHVPVTFITSSIGIKGADSVSHDPAKGTYLAMAELIRTGHQRVCLLNCPRSFQVWPKRVDGMKMAADEFNYSLDEDMLLSVERNTAEGAYLAFEKLLDSGRRPDAVLAGNNEMALGVMRSFYEHNIRVPDDVSIICYEDSSLCGSLSPALSAVNIQKELMGRTALNFLLDRIKNPDLPIRSVTIEPRLKLRDSIKDRRCKKADSPSETCQISV